MKLQILIPQYKETDEIVKPLLDSIALQQCVDFGEIGVIICNDGTDVYLSDELLKSYPFVVEYYKETHRGVSATRNACLDKAIADYVMFCDADDMFCSMTGLYVVFAEIDKGFDTMVSCFTEEGRHQQTGEPILVDHEHDHTFVHGKVHRRQYLFENGIRFNDSLTIHEDSYFNILCQSLTTNQSYVKEPFYLWRYREESICRSDPKYLLKTFGNMVDSVDALIETLTIKGETDKAIYHVLAFIFDTYYRMQKPEWNEAENKVYRESAEQRMSEFYNKYKDTWHKVRPSEKMQISNDARSQMIKEGMQMESITIDEWLKNLPKVEYSKESEENDESDNADKSS